MRRQTPTMGTAKSPVDLSSRDDQGYGLTPGGYARAPRRPRRGVYDGPVQQLARQGYAATAIEDILHLKRGQIGEWQRNPEFRASFEEAQEFARKQAEGVIDSSLADVARALVDVATRKAPYVQGETEAQIKAALPLLTGRRVLEREAAVKIGGDDNRQLTITVKSEECRDIVGDIVEGKRADRHSHHN